MHRLDALVAPHLDRLVTIRRDLHAHPELGYEEVRTSGIVETTLRELGYAPARPIPTGVIADAGAQPGGSVALRADMDCLPLAEANGFAHASKTPGRMHACGHDGHPTILLGAAMALAAVRGRLPGRVRFLFQPAEEGGGGAAKMIAGGALDGVDRVFGLHNWPSLALDHLATKAGPLMAASAKFEVTVRGQGGHASQPALTRDPVLAACQCVSALQALISRETDFSTPAVLSVCQINGGSATNIIPDTVTFAGTVRSWNDEQSDALGRRIGEVASAVAGAHGCTASTEWNRYYPVTRNHAAETALVQDVGAELFGADRVTDAGLPMMGAEDFSFYLQERPGCFFFLGGGAPGRTNAVCHSTVYDFNDDLILRGVRCYLRIVERALDCTLA